MHSVLEKDRQSQRNGQLKLLRHGFAQNDTIALDHYWNYEEIDRYIEFLLKNHAETVEAERIGYSFEGRELRALKISKHGEVDGSRPIIFIDAGTHAREWVSHMSAVYLLHKLVEHRDRNELLQHVDWIIVPIVNPDGFIYSHTTVSASMLECPLFLYVYLISEYVYTESNVAYESSIVLELHWCRYQSELRI